MTVKFKSVIKQNFKLVVLLASKQLEGSLPLDERSLLEERAESEVRQASLEGVDGPAGP